MFNQIPRFILKILLTNINFFISIKMSEIIITENQINEFIDKKLKELDDIHNRIKNKLIHDKHITANDEDLLLYQHWVNNIDNIYFNFKCLYNQIKND